VKENKAGSYACALFSGFPVTQKVRIAEKRNERINIKSEGRYVGKSLLVCKRPTVPLQCRSLEQDPTKALFSHLLFGVRVLLTLACLNFTATKGANKFLADKPDRPISKNRKASITYYPEFISSPFKRGNNTRQIVGSFFIC